MTYIFTVSLLMDDIDEDTAKQFAATALRSLAILNENGVIDFDKLAISMTGPDGSDIPLLPPQFP